MPVGAGIVCLTLLVLLAVGLWGVAVNRKRTLIRSAVTCLVVMSGVMSLVTNGWSKPKKSRLQVPTELAGVRLGMTPAEVTVALGKPTTEEGPSESDSGETRRAALRYSYTIPNDNEYALEIVFYTDANGLRVDIVCELGGYSSALGFNNGARELGVVRKLGRPDITSISADRRAKLISYPQWKVAYLVKRSKVNGVCISGSGTIKFTEQARPRRPRR